MFGHGRVEVGCLAAVGIPSAAAFVSGLLVGLVAAGGTLLYGVGNIAINGLFFGALGGLVSWPLCLSWWGNILLGGKFYQQEQRSYTSYTTRLELVSDNGRTTNIVHLPVSPKQLREFAHGIQEGRSLTEAAWLGDDFTRSEFVALRDALIKGGMAEWINPMAPARGWLLTRTGRAAMKYYARDDETSPPFVLDVQPKLQQLR